MKTIHIDESQSEKRSRSDQRGREYTPHLEEEERENRPRSIPIHSLAKKIMAVEWAKAWGKSPTQRSNFIREKLWEGDRKDKNFIQI
ncbi:hypothetical protein KGY73_08780 [bacterium]|nr:hypothetical protein [bacterium]